MYSFVTKQIMKGPISYIKTSLFDLFTKNLFFFTKLYGNVNFDFELYIGLFRKAFMCIFFINKI